MSYDKDVNVKLEDVNNSTNISLSIPMEYLWNKLSEDDLFNITKMFISNGYLTKIIKELINEESIEYGAFGSYFDKEYIIFKETLISLIDELKENYVNDLKEIEKMRWWSIGRSVERVIKIIYPDRKISYSVDPYDKGFYIIDKDNNDDNVLIINFSALSKIDLSNFFNRLKKLSVLITSFTIFYFKLLISLRKSSLDILLYLPSSISFQAASTLFATIISSSICLSNLSAFFNMIWS